MVANRLIRLTLNTITAVALGSSLAFAGGSQSSNSEPPAGAVKAGILGVDLSSFDKSVRPQDDFFHHTNGEWLKTFEIPADKSNYGAFTLIYDKTEVELKQIIDDALKQAKEKKAGTHMQKVGDMYASYMDEAQLEKLGVTPLRPGLKAIAELQDKSDLAKAMAEFSIKGATVPFNYFVMQDRKDATVYALYLFQSGLGMPDRNYYLDESFSETREKYDAYITKLLELADWKNPREAAKRIVGLETQFATHHWERTDNRDKEKTYNKMTVAELAAKAPAFDWQGMFAQGGVKNLKDLIVSQPSYFEAFGKLFAETDLQTWRDYLAFHYVNSFSPYLNDAFFNAQFDFNSKTLSGLEAPSDRWKRGIQAVNGSLGELVGQEYVERHFSPEAKARMQELVGNLIRAFGDGIDNLQWMSADTKKAAREKLAKFTPKIGYPDKWRDYSDLQIKGDDLFGNIARSRKFSYRQNMEKLGKPVDRDEWFMTPQTVNAYYNSGMNEIVFPAAILQPPFFNMTADDAVNYGGIGAVIGHEIGHGFDDQGSRSDGDGNMRNWWTENDATQFSERTDLLVKQYDSFSPLEGQKVNGQLTLGENIGDLGGLTIAYRAYKLSLNGKEAPVIDGFTGDQRFFLGWSQVWKRKYREKELIRRLMTDPHSPAEYRVNGVLSNMPEFMEAFGVKEGDGMWRPVEERVKIW